VPTQSKLYNNYLPPAQLQDSLSTAQKAAVIMSAAIAAAEIFQQRSASGATHMPATEAMMA
jgi:hypothetical protein